MAAPARQAGLERLTIELKAVGALRAYAQMLLDEVDNAFNADTTANVSASERRERLSENLLMRAP